MSNIILCSWAIICCAFSIISGILICKLDSNFILVAYFLIITLILIGCYPLYRKVHIKRFDWPNPKNLFVSYYILQIGIYGAVILITKETSNPMLNLEMAYNQTFFIYAIGLSIIGLLLFYYGYSLSFGKLIAYKLPAYSKWHVNRIKIILPLYATVSIFSTYNILKLQGGIDTLLSNYGSWRSYGLIGVGYLLYPATALLPTAVLGYTMISIKRNRSYLTILKAGLLMGISVFPAFLFGFRNSFAPPLIQFLAILHYRYKNFSIKKLIIICFIGLTVLTFYGIVRGQIEDDYSIIHLSDFGNKNVRSQILASTLLRIAGVETIMQILETINSGEKYAYWRDSILETVTIFIPRSIWPEKPKPQMLVFGDRFMFDYLYSRDGFVGEATGGFSPTVIGYLFWQMGIIGVIIGMFVLGILCKTAYTYLKINPDDNSRLMLFTIAMTSFLYITESPQDGLNGLFVHMLFDNFFIFLMII